MPAPPPASSPTPAATSDPAPAPTTRGRRAGGILGFFVRPTTPPLWAGVLVAIGLLGVETLLVLQLKRVAPENAFGAVFLLGVLVVSAGWGLGLAVATSLASAAVYVYFHHLEGAGSLAPALAVFLTVALLANLLGALARLRTVEAEQRRREAEASGAQARALARQQAALRRVATRVARGAQPTAICPAAAEEVAAGLAVEHATVLRFDGDRVVVEAARDAPGRVGFAVGQSLDLAGTSIAAVIRRTGEPARIDDLADADGEIAGRLRELGLRDGAGTPITVDGQLWGAIMIGTRSASAIGPDAAAGIGDFADLVATAITNARTRDELRASRARIVAAADQARRGFERDLHDGAQQRIVALGLQLRALEADVPDDQAGLRDEVAAAVDSLGQIHVDLQEFSRGIHPAILSRGGLGPAVRGLARRSAVPVVLDLDVGRLPEPVEVASYYLVAEALTNTAKYAQATEVFVTVRADAAALTVRVGDDGVGGAVLGAGSGLLGLKDRVEALSGRLELTSPAGQGTTVTVVIPLARPASKLPRPAEPQPSSLRYGSSSEYGDTRPPGSSMLPSDIDVPPT